MINSPRFLVPINRSLEEKSAEDTGAFTSTLKEFRTDKVTMQNEIKRLTELLNQKVAAYSVIEEKLACLEEDYARDKRAAEIYRRVSLRLSEGKSEREPCVVEY